MAVAVIYRMWWLVLAAELAGLAPISALLAQPVDLPMAADEDWQHEWTAMTFPVNIGTFERDKVSQFEDRQSNIAANYFEDATGSNLTIYVYRPGLASTAIWFDRALYSIVRRGEDFGKVDLDDLKIGTFVASGGTAPSGQYAVTKVEGRIASTAVALYSAGEWLVKVRISSSRLNVGEMETLLKSTVAGLSPLNDLSSASAYFMKECTGSLMSERSRLVELEGKDTAAIAIAAVMASSLNGLPALEDSAAKPVRYCRVGKNGDEFSIYHPEGYTTSYLIALSDAGRHIEVHPSPKLNSLVGPTDGRNVYSVIRANALETEFYLPTVGLPGIALVSATLNRPAIAKVSRPLGGEGATISILIGDNAEGK